MTLAGKTSSGARPLLGEASFPATSFGLRHRETYPGQTKDDEKSFAFWKSQPCEVFIASHGQFFHMKEKKAALDAGKGPTPSSTPKAAKPSSTAPRWGSKRS